MHDKTFSKMPIFFMQQSTASKKKRGKTPTPNASACVYDRHSTVFDCPVWNIAPQISDCYMHYDPAFRSQRTAKLSYQKRILQNQSHSMIFSVETSANILLTPTLTLFFTFLFILLTPTLTLFFTFLFILLTPTLTLFFTFLFILLKWFTAYCHIPSHCDAVCGSLCMHHYPEHPCI